MNKVFTLQAAIDAKLRRGGEPPYDGDMERIAKLEAIAEKTGERLAAIERDLAVVKSNYATKADLHEAINGQTWKLIIWTTSLGASMVAVTFFLARH